MNRSALVVGNSAGDPESVEAVLARFGFTAISAAEDRPHALSMLRDAHFDLIVIPLENSDPSELLALERELHRNGNTVVIGTSPVPDPDLIVRAMRAGVQEFLVSPPAAEELTASVGRLMRRSRTETARGELFAVYSGKGGLGSTSIAVNLAQAFAKERSSARVALADLVVAGGDVRVFLNLNPAYDLGHLVHSGGQPDADLLNSLMTPCPGGLWVLPTSENPELGDDFDSEAIGSILQLLSASFAATVVDCEHHLSDRTLIALDRATRILLVTHLNVPALRSTQRTLAVCRRLGYDEAKLCIVVNRYQSGDVLSLSDAEDLLQCPVFWKLPNDYKLSAASLTKGVPVSLEEPDSGLARSYRDLAIKLSGGLASHSRGRLGRDAGGGSKLRRLFGIKPVTGNGS